MYLPPAHILAKTPRKHSMTSTTQQHTASQILSAATKNSRQSRKLIPAACYKKSALIATMWLIIDIAVYFSGIMLVTQAHNLVLRIAGSLLAGVGVAMLYIWAHDAAHNALFKSQRTSRFWSAVAMLPSFSMCRHWVYGHNKVHHGFTSLTAIDSIWRPLSPIEYQDLTRMQKIAYRFHRSLPGCGFYYLYAIWWRNMVCYTPRDRHTKSYYNTEKTLVLTSLALMLGATYILCGGISGIILATVVPFLVFNYFIGLIIFLNHTHPNIPFFYNKSGWSQYTAAIKCSTIIHCSKLGSLMLHNILLHTAHHLDTRIPFYHLKTANQALVQEHAEDITQYRFSWKQVLNIFASCQLYDYINHAWHSREVYKRITDLPNTPQESVSNHSSNAA